MPVSREATAPSSDATRPRSQLSSSQAASWPGILATASDGSLNRPPSSDLLLRKESKSEPRPTAEKRAAAMAQNRPGPVQLMEELLKPSFVVRPHPPNVLAKALTLHPLMLLPREHLALSCIDLSAPHGELPPSGRFFESRIRILELEGRLGSNVLIARSETSQNSYALERHDNGQYVVCKLGAWVSMADLCRHATVTCRQRINISRPPSTTTGTFEPPLLTPGLYKVDKRKRQAIEEIQSLVRKKPRSQSVSTASVQAPTQLPSLEHEKPESAPANGSPDALQQTQAADTPPVHPPAPSPRAAALENLEAQQTADGLFQNIRTQYFEALYHSKGSLAYFAKGPLSRARAAFQLNCDSNLEMSELIEFLKSLVLTTVLIDKKFLSTMPEMVDQMKLLVESSDDGEAHQKQAKKKQLKKMKLGKNGMYPCEAASVRKWWNAIKPELRDDETSVSPDQVRYHVSCLRRRETLLQMILVLEILALEASQPVENPADVELPGLAPPTPAKPTPTDGAKKKRNKHNLPVLLDVHADRLCIWESTTLDDVKALAESQSRGGEMRKSDKPLVDFCVDVILPFFSARLPEPCDSLNRKLGGPVIAKPDPKLRRREKAKPKPGSALAAASAPTVKRGHSKSSSTDSRSLERVLSNERLRRSVSRGPGDALAHLRNATIAPIPGIKREHSEVRSLKDLPAVACPPPTANDGQDQPGNLFTRSESFTKYEEIKVQKKARVDAELKDAITALKKPNRELAGRAMVEETERRLFKGPQYIRKTKAKAAPKRQVLDQVQVKATPANNRFRDVLADEADPQCSYLGCGGEDRRRGFNLARDRYKTLPLPEATMTPRSSGVVANTPAVKRTLARQQSFPTPTTVSSRLLQVPARGDFVPASSPLQTGGGGGAKQHLLTETPAKRPWHRPDPFLAVTPVKSGGVMGSPASSSSAAAVGVADVPATPDPLSRPGLKRAATLPRPNIYQQLGWDDDEDELA